MSEANESAVVPVGVATVRTLAMPKDTNGLGDIFGGWLMSHADIAGAILAYRRACGRVVTVSVNDFVFLKPVYVGDIVAFHTELTRVGTTSLAVSVEVWAERPQGGRGGLIKVATAAITYVHIDSAGRPQAVPATVPDEALGASPD
jgi:acyl-CoA thioesterase YciA